MNRKAGTILNVARGMELSKDVLIGAASLSIKRQDKFSEKYALTSSSPSFLIFLPLDFFAGIISSSLSSSFLAFLALGFLAGLTSSSASTSASSSFFAFVARFFLAGFLSSASSSSSALARFFEVAFAGTGACSFSASLPFILAWITSAIFACEASISS